MVMWQNGDKISVAPPHSHHSLYVTTQILAHLLTLLSSGDYRCCFPLLTTDTMTQVVAHLTNGFTFYSLTKLKDSKLNIVIIQVWKMNKLNCLMVNVILCPETPDWPKSCVWQEAALAREKPLKSRQVGLSNRCNLPWSWSLEWVTYTEIIPTTTGLLYPPHHKVFT